MVKHGHDMHYMLVVLILAFFIVTLSVNQLDDGVTGNVVRTNNLNTEGFVVSFLRSTTVSPEFKAVSTKNLLDPINFDTQEIPWSDFFKLPSRNIGGQAVTAYDGTTNTGCAWINLNNNDFSKIKTLTGQQACEKLRKDSSCLMTNSVKTITYFEDSEVKFRDESNSFGNCDGRIKTVSASYNDGSSLVQENGYVTAFCCK